MCNGFGMIVTSELKGYFVEPDASGNVSHTEILKRLGWKDSDNQFTRRFVRVECGDWKIGSFQFDEDGTLPGWAEEHKEEIISLVDKTLTAAAPAWAEYQKVRAPALAEYQKVNAPALAEYQKVRAPALAEYQKVSAAAWAEYQKVRAPAWAEYEKVRAAAWAEYQKVRAAAWAEFIKILSTIPGYVAEK